MFCSVSTEHKMNQIPPYVQANSAGTCGAESDLRALPALELFGCGQYFGTTLQNSFFRFGTPELCAERAVRGTREICPSGGDSTRTSGL